MQAKEDQKSSIYDVGLDVGTNSVGWAVLRPDGKMYRIKGKNAWGVNLFDAASTAKERRIARSTRRRLARRRMRILWLQELIGEDVLALDDAFFLRLEESALYEGDKLHKHYRFGLPKAVFENEEEADYPTIYHVRQALCHTDNKADIRWVYLALHHIIKYRGNFLYEGQRLEEYGESVESQIMQIMEMLLGQEYADILPSGSVAFIKRTLSDKLLSRSEKRKAILDTLSPDNAVKPVLVELFKAILDYEIVWERLLGHDVDKEEQTKVKLTTEGVEETLLSKDPDQSELIALLMQIYRWAVFASIRNEGESISDTMVRRYKEHKEDLCKLKRLIKTHYQDEGGELYKSLFLDGDDKHSYDNYCQKSKLCTKDDFHTKLRKELGRKEEMLKDDPDYLHCMTRMEADRGSPFLPLQRSRDNGVIPNQFHVQELEMILDKQARYYPALAANKEKIRAICTFRIPYHVGPLNPHSPFAWVKRKGDQAVRPWNFVETVDVSASAIGFMDRLKNTCTYLPGEPVLPRYSPLYQEYCLLEELNKVHIIYQNGTNRMLGEQERRGIISDLFKRYRSVSKTRAIDWLKANGDLHVADLSGLRKENAFEATLSTSIDLTSQGIDTNDTSTVEGIVYYISMFQDKKMLKEQLSKFTMLNQRQIAYLCHRPYQGWGRLSGKLLQGILGDYNSKKMSIIDIMRHSTLNFMQMINDPKLKFDSVIEASQAALKGETVSIDEVRELSVSPALHRGIWQAVKIIEEISKAMDGPPRAIYVEVSRDDRPGKKNKVTKSRLNQLIELYEKTKPSEGMTHELFDGLKELKRDGGNVEDERLFLYYLQQGKCLYTKQSLDVKSLSDYDVDHIVPQSYKKDDSINNKALVLQSANREKADSLVVPLQYRRAQSTWWNTLRQQGLMSEYKYRNLMRDVFDEEELGGFLNRQLVETSQMIKSIIILLRQAYPQSTINAVKAQLGAAVRDQYGIIKMRELNDYHHAHDALITANLGQFTASFMPWMQDEKQRQRNVREYMRKNPSGTGGIALGFFNDRIINSQTSEVHDPGRVAAYLRAAYGYSDCFITRKAEQAEGTFYNITRLSKADNPKLLPIKKGFDVAKYGGFENPGTAYIAAVEHTNARNCRTRQLVNIPILYAQRIDSGKMSIKEYLETRGEPLQQVNVLCAKILKGQLALYEGHLLWLSSATEARNACQLLFNREAMSFLGKVMRGEPLLIGDMTPSQFIERYLDKLRKHYSRYKGFAQKLLAQQIEWSALNAAELRSIIIQLLRVTAASGACGEFRATKASGLGSAQGRMTNVNFDLDKLILIDQSVTGVFEKRRCYGISDHCHQSAVQVDLQE